MPDEHDEPDDLDENESSVIRELRKRAKRVDEAESETATLRTENAILKAGLTDLSEARQKALLAAHSGDMTPEAIRETAVDLGFAEAPKPPDPQVPAEEQAAHQRAQEAANGAEPAEAHPEELNDRIAKAKSPQELDRILADAGVSVNAEG